MFEEIGKIPCPVVTRWGLWLEAVIFYSRNFDKLKDIVNGLIDENLHNNKVKNSFMSSTVERSIEKIVSSYEKLLDLIESSISEDYSIKQGHSDVIKTKFQEDFLNISEYMNERIAKTDIGKIVNNELNEYSPFLINCLKKCPAVSISI